MELWWQKWIAVSLLEDFCFQSQNQGSSCYSGIGVNICPNSVAAECDFQQLAFGHDSDAVPSIYFPIQQPI